jgi:hypothetical protein
MHLIVNGREEEIGRIAAQRLNFARPGFWSFDALERTKMEG